MRDIEKIEWVYNQLADEKSKLIFENRRKYSESGGIKYIEKIVGACYPEWSHNVYYGGKEKLLYSKLKDSGKKIVLWGLGYRGKKVLKECKINDIKVDFIVDSNSKKQGSVVEGIRVVSLEEVVQKENVDECIFLITPMYCVDEIQKKLTKHQCHHIEILNDYSFYYFKNQYFEEEIISFDEHEVFIDGGCFDLETTKYFIGCLAAKGKTYKKIYAFEPDTKNYEKCKSKIKEEKLENIDIVNVGLWSRDTYVKMKNSATAGAYIVESAMEDEGGGQAVALDSYISMDEKVTFIKFDIEGAELEALEGAKAIIATYKPKLAICLYHKKEDYWQIPYYIKRLVPDYKLYIRHYSNSAGETVLYAVQ